MQNAIPSFPKVENKKLEILETQASSHVLPSHIHSNDLDPTLIPASEDFPLNDKNNGRRNADSGEVRGNGMLPPPTGFEPPKLLPTYNQQFRRSEESRLKQLGLPFQQTQQRVQQPAAQFAQQNPRPVVSNQAFQSTKKPVVKTFDPDKNFKAFEHILQFGKKATHKDYDFSRYFTKKDGAVTVAPVQRRQDVGTGFNRQQSVAQPTTARPFVNNKFSQQTQRTFAPVTRQVVTTRTTPRTTTTVRTTTRTTTRPTTTTRRPITQAPRVQQTFKQNQKNTQFTQGFNRQPAVPSKPATQQVAFNRNAIPAPRQPAVPVPANDLLPPLDGFKNYDDATTKGPAIYSQWKVPERGLVPPNLINETEEMQSKRSILEEGNFGTNNDFQSSETRRLGNGNTIKVQYKDLQRMFSIPEYEFPLESKGRDGYENAEAVNSFQVKIPYKSGNADRYYYLEHAHCNPECHPYFFKPNRCEPCVKL